MTANFKLLTAWIAILSLIACSNSKKQNLIKVNTYILKQKIEGNENILLQYKYIPVIKGDTQDFWMKFGVSKTNKYFIGIDKNTKINHTMKLEFIKQVLDTINQEFPLRSISQIEPFDMGRSSSNEELALKLSEEYFSFFGENINPNKLHPDTLGRFLANSFLARDLNEVLKPYNLKINNIRPEKAFLVSKSKLPHFTNPENKLLYFLDTWLWVSISSNTE